MKRAETIVALQKLGFKMDDKGLICYKRFNLFYGAPKSWRIRKGAFITRPVSRDLRKNCDRGINAAKLGWVNSWGRKKGDQGAEGNRITALWKCRVRYEDFHRLIIPTCSPDKIRCGRLELLHTVDTRGRRLSQRHQPLQCPRLPVRAPQRKVKGVSKPKRRNQ